MGDLKWCSYCGEGVTTFCRGKGEVCGIDLPKPGQRNQCDGCQAGMPVNQFGNHTVDGRPDMACEKHRYIG